MGLQAKPIPTGYSWDCPSCSSEADIIDAAKKDFERRLIPPSPVAQPNWPAPARPTPPPLAPINGGSPRGDGNRQPGRTPRVVIEVNGAIVGSRQLDKPILTVGRLTGNDIQIPSQRVSRLHARIRWENGSWLIEDADSLNGISFRGNRIDRHTLTNGDRIMLGPKAALHYKAA